MKVTLEFDIPEEKEEHYYALNGHLYSIVVDNIIEHLRKLTKYQNQDIVNIDDLRQFIVDQLKEYELR